MGRVRRWVTAASVAAALGLWTQGASAQYFGRNKVQYRTFKFEVLHTQHFDVYFYPEERAAVQQAALMAERWYVRLSKIFIHELSIRQPLILYGSHTDFEQTNVVEGELGEGTGGVTEGLKRRIVLPLGGSLAESDHVIGHELVHAFQYDITDLHPGRPTPGGTGLERLPLWFVEGMAEYLSLGPIDPNTAMWMRDAASQEKMPGIKELERPQYFPYRWGQALWAYLTGRYGDSVVGSLLRTGASSGSVEVAMRSVLGVENLGVLSDEWHKALRDEASEVRQRTRRISDVAKPLERGTNELNGYNVSPSLSPDGRRMMFLSQRDIVSIDLYLADAETGEVRRKVVNATFDPHFSSLGFINSAGAWSADSRRFVFAAVQGGQPSLVVLDVNAGTTEKEIRFQGLGEIFSPTWSPDGGSIAFSALQGGWTDLFVYDLRTGKTRRLTHDAFADLQPAWSPDGKRLAFVSDRFTTRLADLDTGAYQVVLLDLASGQMRAVEGASTGKNINPQWSRDGQIYFVSDRTGISNIYRVDPKAGPPVQVTNVPTGVSGITALSPAISYAPVANRLAFSVYENSKYSIYALDATRVASGEPHATVIPVDPARLPPERRTSDELMALQRDPSLGLPAGRDARTTPYDGRLSLDMVGQPYVTAGVDSFGTFVGGGVALFWSDILGDYSLGTAVQANGGFGGGWSDIARDIGAQVAFENRKHRWNYGVIAGQVPYLSAAFATGTGQQSGTPVGIGQTIIFRQLDRSAAGILSYPLNTAQRLEFTGGIRNISFDQQVETTTYDLASGTVLSDQRQSVPTSGALNLGQFSAALVYDTATYGATSPVAGQRYRLQVAPTVGSLRYTTVLADYRRYVMPAPFYTLAGRLLHFGRYGPGAQDPRLVPTYLGYPDLVRGYDLNSFTAGGCTTTALGTTCPEFDRLLGSRVLIGNLEFRFPLLRPFGVKREMYGPLPLELAFFGDAGVAWNAGEKPSIFGGQRRGVSSAGVALRANLFGALVAELDAAKPFQRSGRGWVLEFNILPGF